MEIRIDVYYCHQSSNFVQETLMLQDKQLISSKWHLSFVTKYYLIDLKCKQFKISTLSYKISQFLKWQKW